MRKFLPLQTHFFSSDLVLKLVLLFISSTAFSNAQNSKTDSVILLKEFSVEALRQLQISPGNKSEKLDSSSLQAPIAQNLSDLLTQSNSFFIKSYGIGSLSTASFRGSSASQTAILWNGFNLQSPMYGMLDYALIPALFVEEVSLNYGGVSALYGSGSVGGTIIMNNNPTFNTGFKFTVSTSAGSFDAYQQSLKLRWSNSKFSFQVKVFNHSAENNYPFINTAIIGKPKQIQENAALKQSGVLVENYFHLNTKQLLSIRFWYQSTNRELPPSIVSAATKQSQLDEFYRGNIEWTHNTKFNHAKVRAAYFDERLNFNYPEIGLFSYSRSRTLCADVQDTYFIKDNINLTLGINTSHSTAISDGYSKSLPIQKRFAGFAALNYASKNKTWKSNFTLRKELYRNLEVPITAALGSKKIFFSLITLRGNISKNYRLPTYNDFFWKEQGAIGNADLKPESGWSSDLGVGEFFKQEKFSIESEISIFSNEVKNMIVWQPGESGVWSPQNVSSVWSRGLESFVNLIYAFNSIQVDVKAKYNHTLSTENVMRSGNSQTYGKQIFYVPLAIYQFEASVLFKGIKLKYTHNYTGKRFTNNENTEYLKAFQIGSAVISKNFTLKKMRLSIYIQAANIWNKHYQAIAWRPMPLRNYLIGLSIGI